MAWPFSLFKTRDGVDGLPPALRAELEPEGILAAFGKVGASQRFSGSVPGCHSGLSVCRHSGLVVLTRRRLYALLPTAPRLKEPAIDQPWDVPQAGPAKVAINSSGLVVTIDLKRVDPRFSGELKTTFKTNLADDVLEALPTRSLAFHVSPAYVFSSLGVRVKP